jgi:hypothetical protein
MTLKLIGNEGEALDKHLEGCLEHKSGNNNYTGN